MGFRELMVESFILVYCSFYLFQVDLEIINFFRCVHVKWRLGDIMPLVLYSGDAWKMFKL